MLADGGGHGSIAAAVAGAPGPRVPELPDADGRLRCARSCPPAPQCNNPVDLAGGAERDVHAFDRIALQLLGSAAVDALLITGYFGGYAEYSPEMAAEELTAAALIGEAAQRHRPARGGAHHVSARPRGRGAARGRRAGVRHRRAGRGGAVAAWSRPTASRHPSAYPSLPAPATPVRDRRLRGGALSAGQRRDPVRRPSATVSDAAQALAAARELGYPVVLKALGRLHKSDAGGVVLGIADDAALVTRLRRACARRLAPERCSVERMAPLSDGVELLIGARWDARFGPVALAGSGGVYAEVLRDTAVALAPISERRGRGRCCARCALAPLLLGARGRPRAATWPRAARRWRPCRAWPPPTPSSPSSRSTPCWSRRAARWRSTRASSPPHPLIRSRHRAVHLHPGAARPPRARQPPDRRDHPLRGAMRGGPRAA